MKVKIKFERIGALYTEEDLINDINCYKEDFKVTYTSYGRIINVISKVFYNYYKENGFDCPEDEIHIPVCSDWEDKVYVFEPEMVAMIDDIVYFKVMYKGIYKM